jgi:hypothetical protein
MVVNQWTNGGFIVKRIVFVWIAAMVLWPSLVAGQQRPGRIRGQVVDAAGSPVANVSITVRNIAARTDNTVETDQKGSFLIADLQPGTYSIQSQRNQSGANDPQSTVNSGCTTDLTLQTTTTGPLAVMAEVVTQEEGTAPVENTFSERQIELLPQPNAVSRTGEYFGAYNLSLLSEGVSPGFILQNGVGPAVGGRPNTSNNFHVNGVDNNNQAVPGPLVTVSNEVTTEFSLMQNQHAPQVGHSTGGKFNLVLAQGTNAWHGGVYDYLQNRQLNARDQAFGDNRDLRFDQNRMGGKIGGPIWRDRLFAFFALEYIPLRAENRTLGTVLAPTPLGFAALGGTTGVSTTNLAVLRNNVQVSNSPVAVTTVAGTVVPLGIVDTGIRMERDFWNGMTNWDWMINNRSSLSARYVHNDIGTDSFGTNLPAFNVPGHKRALLGNIGYSGVFGVATGVHLNFGYNRLDQTVGGGSFTFPGQTAFPNIGITSLGLALGSNTDFGRARANTYQGSAEVDWTASGHHLTFGVDFRNLISTIGNFSTDSGNYGYSTLERYLLDLPPDVVARRSFGGTSFHGNQQLWYFYGQDSIRLTPNFNLELGLGYQYASLPASFKRQVDFAALSVPGVITFDEPETDNLNLAPRIGFAWSPNARRTVVRGSFGIMYDALNRNSAFLSPDVTFGTVTTADASVPGFLGRGGIAEPVTTRSSVGTWIPEQKLPYIMHWTAAVSHEFFDRLATEIKYMGNRGVHQPFVTFLNDPGRVTATSSLPVFFTNPGTATIENLTLTQSALAARTDAFTAAGFTNPIFTVRPDGNSWYNAFAIKINERFTAGTQVAAQYTWSDARTDATGTPLDLVYGRRKETAPWNVKHRATVTPILDVAAMLPQTTGWVRSILADLSLMGTITYASAQTVPLFSAIDTSMDGNAFGTGVFVNPAGAPGVGSGSTPLRRSDGEVVAFLANNPSAQFVTGGPGTFSTARPTLRLGDTRNIDVALVKRFSFPDRAKIEIRGDAYNIFNRRQLTGLPVSTLGSGLGLATSPNFLLVSNPQFNDIRGAISSNPRTFQLALRVIF